jgi:hypothetical protein
MREDQIRGRKIEKGRGDQIDGWRQGREAEGGRTRRVFA